MTAAWQHAVRRSRLRHGLCPGCGGKITMGYGLMGGNIGPYQVCLNRRCPDPHFETWPDPEMEEPASEADCTAAGASAERTVRSSSAKEPA